MLRRFPELGALVPELEDLGYREIVREDYRIIYLYDGRTVTIAAVRHGSEPLTARSVIG